MKRGRWKPLVTGVKVEFPRNPQRGIAAVRRTLSHPNMMMLAWTTVSKREDADRLAAASVSAGLAACVQVDGPIASYYRWEGRTEHQQEFRLTFKTLPDRLPALEVYVLANHPYATPEWIVCAATRVSEKYLSWARTSAHS